MYASDAIAEKKGRKISKETEQEEVCVEQCVYLYAYPYKENM